MIILTFVLFIIEILFILRKSVTHVLLFIILGVDLFHKIFMLEKPQVSVFTLKEFMTNFIVLDNLLNKMIGALEVSKKV